MARAIPDRWLNYKPIGKRIEGTRFIAFKVPLRQDVVKSVEADIRLDNEGLLKDIPNLGLIIDLTNTNRYYNPDFFRSHAVEYKKLMIPGHVTPTEDLVNRFKLYVMSFLNSNKDNDKLIGVHCTHGVNRTGYLICNYMISELSINSKEAIKRFATARGHHIERQNYLQSLQELTKYSQPHQSYQHNARQHKDSYQRHESHHHDRRSNHSHNYPTHNNASSSIPTNDNAAYRKKINFSSSERDESRNRFSNNDRQLTRKINSREAESNYSWRNPFKRSKHDA